jgi:hypothetical protein
MTDRVIEVALPEGTLRVEQDGTETDMTGRLSAWLDGEPVSRERALEMVERARNR